MRMPVEQIYGTGENRQKHVQIVRHYLNGHAEFSVEFGEHVHRGTLAGQIKIGERFIQHEQLGVRHQRLRDGDALPQAQKYYAEAISLPMYSALTEAQQDEVVAAVRKAVQ